MQSSQQKAMFASIQGHKIKLGRMITINTGKKDRHVKLVEQHKKAPNKICVLQNGKKFLVLKSKVVL
jgi:hypothetical protein